jgi:UDP-N-acetylmuramate dehydrogenase
MNKARALLLERLSELSGVSFKAGCTGAQLTHMKVGGQVGSFLQATDLTGLKEALRILHFEGKTWRILGAGSNVVLGDLDQDCWVIRLGGSFETVRFLGGGLWEFGAAAPLIGSSLRMTRSGWSGLEFAAGIPGVIGGALAMNAGAHGSCMAEVVKWVRVLRAGGVEQVLSAKDLEFGYRTSVFQDSAPTDVILGAVLSLEPGDPEVLLNKRAEALAYRKATQPLTVPSSGSVFQNPTPEMAAGMLIESVGLKGHRIGGAMISDLHANWIVNPDRSASAGEIVELMRLCQKRVLDVYGLNLKPEIQVWGSVSSESASQGGREG